VRRRLHALLVGVLALSLAFDTAQACGHRRRGCRPRPCLPVPCAVPCGAAAWVVVPARSWCGPVAVACEPWSTWQPCGDAAAWAADCRLPQAVTLATDCGQPVISGIGGETECCGGLHSAVIESFPVAVEPGFEVAETVVAETPAAAAPPVVAESIVAPAAEPTAAIAPLVPAPQPDLRAIEPASATEPAGLVELPPAEPPVAPQPPAAPAAEPGPPAPAAEPVEDNIFEDVPRDTDAEASAAPAAKPAAVAEPAEPAVEPVAEPETAATEPPRRWIDASGAYATVGALVAVRGAAVEIRTAGGRSIVVPLARLSDYDRSYADAAAQRLAARAPGTRDTAGL
jgi:hypothetical protein